MYSQNTSKLFKQQTGEQNQLADPWISIKIGFTYLQYSEHVWGPNDSTGPEEDIKKSAENELLVPVDITIPKTQY